MEAFRYDKGQVIFREGEESLEAYWIAEGAVEIRLGPDSDPQILAVLMPGEILGEMALVADHPRSATAVAREDGTRLIVLSEQYFEEHILRDPQQVRILLAALVERLRNADALIRSGPARKRAASEKHSGDEAFLASAGKREFDSGTGEETLYLESAYDPSLDYQPFEITITKFPFRIGRYFKSLDGLFFSHADLVLEDSAPFQVSRVHCDILCKEGSFFVKDRGSHLGTEVNGVRIGAGSGQVMAGLETGRNEIVLGNPVNSPHRLKILIGTF